MFLGPLANLLSKRTPAAAVQGFSIYRDRFRNDANRNESSALFPINGLVGRANEGS